MTDHNPITPPCSVPGPFTSLRDFMTALKSRGQVMEVSGLDQDAYEATAFMYRLIDKLGWAEAPAVVFSNIKANGRWHEGPVIGNQYGRWEADGLCFGIEPNIDEQYKTYHQVLKKLESLAGAEQQWEEIQPIEVQTENAPCKEVCILGKDIRLSDFPFLQTNPADAGPYITTGSVILEDPERGRNVGTYRCQIKGDRKIAINPEKGQHGWTFLMDMKKRGESSAKVAIVLGTDPITFSMSSSKTTRLGQDELAVAGGFLGAPIDVVKCETNDLRVPANVEMVIEGEIPFDFEPEGPFGEMYGYIGARKEENFYMNVSAVTHRSNPVFVNQFTGVTRSFLTSPMEVTTNLALKQQFPNLLGVHFPLKTPGFCFVRISKTRPLEGLAIGREITKSVKIAKIAIVVDSDINIHNTDEVMHAVGARWQPHPASEIVEKAGAMGGDPSAVIRGEGSRIVIDATRQLPEEGGPKHYPAMNRASLADAAPDIFSSIDKKYGHLIRDWKV
ncbi:MAG: UbiD family decarboxylase [Halieaceae bacterium]|jgi:4-hydroxy-3-polyprenylbenzoate decarboxylase|nr:UbiD family decarboxylase [Halieaceae bacterium]